MATILDLIQPEIAPIDLTTRKTLPFAPSSTISSVIFCNPVSVLRVHLFRESLLAVFYELQAT